MKKTFISVVSPRETTEFEVKDSSGHYHALFQEFILKDSIKQIHIPDIKGKMHYWPKELWVQSLIKVWEVKQLRCIALRWNNKSDKITWMETAQHKAMEELDKS
jgi:hypothetical protein